MRCGHQVAAHLSTSVYSRAEHKGAAIASVVAYSLVFLADLSALTISTGVKIPVTEVFVRPTAAAGLMGIAVWVLSEIMRAYQASSLVTVAVCVPAGVVVFGLLVIVLKAITPSELLRLPGDHSC